MTAATIPWDGEGRYIPDVHAGTRDEIVAGLIAEAIDIINSGMMRLRAKCRELDRIGDELRKHGADLLLGTGESEGFIVFIDRHAAGCPIECGGECHCAEVRRVPSCL